MKIIIDDKIPYIKEAAEKIAEEVIYAPGKDFTRELVQDADALIIRTRTHCNRKLLEGSKVKFIATATIGFDHIDTEYCKQAGIEWANAPGCNSASVAQYIQSSLLIWKSLRNKKPDELTIGIIGVGNVGSKVAKSRTRFRYACTTERLAKRRERRKHRLHLTRENSRKNVISSPFTYLYIRKGNIKHTIWQTGISSGLSNEGLLSSTLQEEK